MGLTMEPLCTSTDAVNAICAMEGQKDKAETVKQSTKMLVAEERGREEPLLTPSPTGTNEVWTGGKGQNLSEPGVFCWNTGRVSPHGPEGGH